MLAVAPTRRDSREVDYPVRAIGMPAVVAADLAPLHDRPATPPHRRDAEGFRPALAALVQPPRQPVRLNVADRARALAEPFAELFELNPRECVFFLKVL